MHSILSTLERDLASALRGLDDGQTQLRLSPDPACWSIHQVVQHLLLTYASTITSFESRLAKGTPTRSSPTAPQRLAKFVVITLGLMPGRRLAPAEVSPPPPARPLSGDVLSATIASSLTELDIIIAQAGHAFGTAPCLSHFALGPLSASEWRRFHLCHGRHHIRQINAIRRVNGV